MKFKKASDINNELRKHFEDDGATMNDSECDRLYREAHGISEDVETDLETVEAWVVDVLSENKKA